MLEHHIQRTILYRLAFAESLNFSSLKPDILDNKLFTYHLQKVVKAGYVEKSADGSYRLTQHGRQRGERTFDKQLAMVNTPESVVFLIIRRASDQAWLLYRRKTHPLRSQIGFMHCLPIVGQNIAISAQTACLEKTGMQANFTLLGGGYITIYHEAGLESYTHFTLAYCDAAVGVLDQDDAYADYFWQTNPDFSSSEFFPTTNLLLEKYYAKEPFFVEKQYDV
jgi:hypothetical protein